MATATTNRAVKVISARRMIDGQSKQVLTDQVIILDGDTIRAIGPGTELDLPSDAESEYLEIPSTSTILPGLIDTHTHLTMDGSGAPLPSPGERNDGVLLMQAAASARTHLHSGVTTVVDAGAPGTLIYDLVQGARLGLVDMPRLIVAGRPITRTGGHAWTMGEEANGPDGVRRSARQMLKEGADFLKVMATGGGTPGTLPHLPSYREDELAVIAAEAHENGKLAVAHCSSTEGHRRCLDAGIDILYHCHFHRPDGVLEWDADVARRLADAPVYVNPTLWINGGRVDVLRIKEQREGLSEAERLLLASRAERYAGQRENVSRMVELGVKMIAGTDAGFAIYRFGDLVTELDEMVICGMSTMGALQAATGVAATALRINDNVGSLTPGLKADLLVVDGDPASDIAALRNVQAVIANGSVVRNDGGLLARPAGLSA